MPMLVVVSDFHLSEGWRKSSKKLSPNEDFFFDKTFESFLHYLNDVAPGDVHLVLNGDTFDFLQVVKTDEAVKKSAGFRQFMYLKKYGGKTTDMASVDKLETIKAGHGRFFDGLRYFLGEGNSLSVVTGNHDVELYWPDVRKRFRQLVGDPDPKRLRFFQWCFYDPAYKIYIEHGNQYEEFNSFLHMLYPLLKNRDQINLPIGSLFVRYFYNQVESDYPFAENMKPASKYIVWLINEYKLHPIRLVVVLGSLMKTLVKTFKRSGGWFKPDEPGDAKQVLDEKLVELGRLFSLSPDRLKVIVNKLHKKPVNNTKWHFINRIYKTLSAFAYTIAIVVFAITPFIWVFGYKRVYDYLVSFGLGVASYIFGRLVSVVTPILMKDTSEYAAEVGRVLNSLGNEVRYLTFGHTHEADIVVPDGIIDYVNEVSSDKRKFINLDKGMVYFNTGTWDVIFSEEEELIRDKMQFACLVFKDRDVEPVLMRWSDCTERCESLPLFDKQGSLSNRLLLYLIRRHKESHNNTFKALLLWFMRCILLYKGHHLRIKN